jgi:hypothetical protein
MIRAAFCRSCGAPIWWCATSSGKQMPVDRQPAPTGNITIDSHGVATVHTQPPLGDDSLHLSHFATCPTASDWRHR